MLDVKMLYYSKFTLIIPWSQVQILLGALNPPPTWEAGIFFAARRTFAIEHIITEDLFE